MEFTNKGHSPPPTTYYWISSLTSMPPHRRRSPSSLISFLNSPLLIIFCPVIIILFVFFTLPSFLSLTSHIMKPTIYVKKSWDSLNIVLVLFAILCGIFAKRNDDGLSSTDHDNNNDNERSQNTVLNSSVSSNTSSSSSSSYAVKDEDESVSLPTQWFGFSGTKFHDDTPIHYSRSPAPGTTRLRRSSSSYPDLRQESLWETGSDDRYQFRFYDDFGIDKFRTPPKDQVNVDDRKRQGEVEEEVGVKVIPVDTFELRSSMAATAAPKKAAETPPPPPPPPPLRVARQRPSRRYRTVHPKDSLDGKCRIINDIEELTSVQCPPPPTPPPPPPSVQKRSEQKHTKSQRRSSVKRDLAMVWATLSNQKKRKKKLKMKNNYFHDYNSASQSSVQTPNYTVPPPPPPPPPPPSVFRSLFKKGTSKSKLVHSIPITPPPPPPPLPPRVPLSSSTRKSKHKTNLGAPPAPPPPSYPRSQNSNNSGKPPLPKKVTTHFNEEIINSGNQSPLIPIPPPPPPPFRMPDMKFIVQGDFVKICSNHSSRCGSPELEDADDEPSKGEEVNKVHVVHGSQTHIFSGPVFCPSPDVNVKAATFIARLRGEWKLEKLNSMKEKGSLGHSPGPSTQT